MLYQVVRSDEGQVRGVRRKLDNSENYHVEVIAEDYNDQRYCDFLSWVSRQESRDWGSEFHVIDKNCAFFSSKNNLIEYCKTNGVMLWTAVDSNGNSSIQTTDCRCPADKRLPAFLGSTPNAFGKVRIAKHERNTDNQTDGLIGTNSRLFATCAAINEISSELKNEDSDSRRISAIPITRSFVYLDVSDFSQYPAGHQALVIQSIVRIAHTRWLWYHSDVRDGVGGIEAEICIGDGYIYVFRQPDNAILFASCFAHFVERLIAQQSEGVPIEFHFRIGIHSGPVYSFWDPGRKGWNYIGEGINGGQRVLTAAGKDKDDVIYVSGEFRKSLRLDNEYNSTFLRDIIRCMSNRGRHVDKHNKYWRLYEVNHDDLVSQFLSLGKIELPSPFLEEI